MLFLREQSRISIRPCVKVTIKLCYKVIFNHFEKVSLNKSRSNTLSYEVYIFFAGISYCLYTFLWG
jgi:hypothetical protein